MDDLDRLITKKERDEPGFKAAVGKRKGELILSLPSYVKRGKT